MYLNITWRQYLFHWNDSIFPPTPSNSGLTTISKIIANPVEFRTTHYSARIAYFNEERRIRSIAREYFKQLNTHAHTKCRHSSCSVRASLNNYFNCLWTYTAVYRALHILSFLIVMKSKIIKYALAIKPNRRWFSTWWTTFEWDSIRDTYLQNSRFLFHVFISSTKEKKHDIA